MRGRSDRSVESAQGTATRLEVRNEPQIQEGIILWTVGRHDKFICNQGEAFDHALNQRTSKKGFKRFIFSHAGGLTTSLDANCEHLVYYKGGPCIESKRLE